MNKSAFLQLIQQVSGITDQQTDELEKVASAFPYCQTAHLLLAKSAYDKGSMLSSQRLRRASSYATNRQLLKKIIYTVPATEVPVYANDYDDTEEPLEEQVAPAQADSIAAEEMVTAAVLSDEEQKDVSETNEGAGTTPEEDESAAEETTPAADNSAAAEELGTGAASEDLLYSELAMLLTINSLSPSSTDLLTAQPDKTAVAPVPFVPELLQPSEAATPLPEELLAEENAEKELTAPATIPSPPEEDTTAEEEEQTSALAIVPAQPEIEQEHQELQPAQPFGEVNYSSDEIDRLYAEDSLGYWMGSSRMGEVLQLKDDYTRLRPQSFHPELILEYSKTHELEKAIQPASNVLSQQLDIIDQFLKLNPRLKTMANLKLKPEPQEDLSLKSTRIRKGMASENLASIFLKQGKVKKAVKIYEQLILKYPEKKTYFAEQIEKLQNLN